MDIILCHIIADFDALGAAVGLARLKPGAKIVLTGGAHPPVRDFLAFHRDEYPLIERRSVKIEEIGCLVVVDTQKRDRLGKAAEWLSLPHLKSIEIYDHHIDSQSDINPTYSEIEPVGATTTLIVEQLQQKAIQLTTAEATVMALGIHVDTGSLTFNQTTPRDAAAIAWLMAQGANVRQIQIYVDHGLSPQLQQLLTTALDNLHSQSHLGYTLSWVFLKTPDYVPGLSSLASRLVDLTESDALLLAVEYRGLGDTGEGGDRGETEAIFLSSHQKNHTKKPTPKNPHQKTHPRLTIIGRTGIEGTNFNELFQPWGGGGHSQAAAVNLRAVNPLEIIEQFIEQLKSQIPQPLTARELMSSPVRTIRPETTIIEAQRILLRYGHSGLSVVDEIDKLVGIISRRDLDLALHHGFSHAPVKGYMTRNVKTINPLTSLPEIESLMVTYDIGRLPVLEKDELVGIVTRTDVLRQLHQVGNGAADIRMGSGGNYCPLPITNLPARINNLEERLAPELWQLLAKGAEEAQKRGWHLYLVGGAVRDLLLADEDEIIQLNDIDLVVDGFHKSGDVGAGVTLAKALQKRYRKVRLEIHGAFQTAALLWHNDPILGSLWVDIATARTEFYPYPAANPEVEASSIRQDLYRRDFTINALALRLTDIRQSYSAATSALDKGGISSKGVAQFSKNPGYIPAPPFNKGGWGGENSGDFQVSLPKRDTPHGNPKSDLPLLDFFGGLLDLRSRQIRVLHPNSFIEDPTRIYRAVRFAVRLGFEIEPQTEAYIRYALASGVYERSLANNNKAPALQTRLKQELKYIFQAPYWQRALQLLGHLEALRCLHPNLHLDRQLWWRVRLVDRWLRRFDPSESLRHWEIRLEVLIAYLAPDERGKVAENLHLPLDSIERLQHLENAQKEIIEYLPRCRRTSEFVRLLRKYNRGLLVLIGVNSPRVIRRQIWQYFTIWANVHSPLNGNELKRMGYKPGPQFKEILEALWEATLDGVIGDEDEARGFLEKYYSIGGEQKF